MQQVLGHPSQAGCLQKAQSVASQSWVNIFSKLRLHKTFERVTPEFCTSHAELLGSACFTRLKSVQLKIFVLLEK